MEDRREGVRGDSYSLVAAECNDRVKHYIRAWEA
jgi:hypothetical protein